MLSNEDRFLESYAIKIQYLCIKIRKFHRTDIFQKKKKTTHVHMYYWYWKKEENELVTLQLE